MKQVNLTIKIPALPVTLGLVVILVLTLFSSVFNTSAETLHRPSADNPNAGVITGCVGSSSPSGQDLILAGRVITPSNLVSLNPSGTCGTNESAVSWNVQGPKGDKGDKGDPTYVSTVIVSPVGSGSDNSELANGAVLLAAVAQVTAANPSFNKTYLIKVEPGAYNLGNNSITLPPYVDLEGSGIDVTRIYSTVGASGSVTNAVIIMSNANEVSDLFIVSNGNSDYNAVVLIKSVGVGIYVSTLRNIYVVIVGSGNGEFYGIYSSAYLSDIDDVKIDIDIKNGDTSNPLTTRKNFGISNNSGSMTIRNSQIKTLNSYSNIAVQSSEANTNIQNSSLTASTGAFLNRGLSVSGGGSVTVQNSNLAALTIKSAQNSAIYNESGNTTVVQNSTLKATGDTFMGGTLDAIYNSGTLRVGASQIAGNVNNTGSLTCVASYDSNFVSVGAQCV